MSVQALLLAGPTASGKTALAIKLAQELNGTIINTDSMQVYRDIDIISAMPTDLERVAAPHKLYGIIPFAAPFSVADWLVLAKKEFFAARSLGSLPIFVGGTGMYFTALLDGLADIPEPDAQIRRDVRNLLKDKGAAFLHQELRAKDPEMASRLKENDGQRIARALEVLRSTGQSLAIWQAKTSPGLLNEAHKAGSVKSFVLERPREELYQIIDKRLVQMVSLGALEEVRALMKSHVHEDASSIKALGIPSFKAYIRGELTKEAAIADAQKQTRRYAKRQMTWFNNRFNKWPRINMSPKPDLDALLSIIKQDEPLWRS